MLAVKEKHGAEPAVSRDCPRVFRRASALPGARSAVSAPRASQPHARAHQHQTRRRGLTPDRHGCEDAIADRARRMLRAAPDGNDVSTRFAIVAGRASRALDAGAEVEELSAAQGEMERARDQLQHEANASVFVVPLTRAKPRSVRSGPSRRSRRRAVDVRRAWPASVIGRHRGSRRRVGCRRGSFRAGA
jgi:hypothetical protein